MADCDPLIPFPSTSMVPLKYHWYVNAAAAVMILDLMNVVTDPVPATTVTTAVCPELIVDEFG